jgi:hydroxymethylbilane synthase
MAQAQLAVAALQNARPELEVEVVPVVSAGDRDQRTDLSRFSEPGIFTRALETALVHSAKDLPSELDPGFCLAAALPREDPHDVLVAAAGTFLMSLPEKARVGTGSPRRKAQLARVREDLSFVAVRGNLETRLARVQDGEVQALILAAAGLKRLGLFDRVTELIPFEVCLPAAGQGAIAIECLDRGPLNALLGSVDDRASSLCLHAERAFLRKLGAGCSAAVGAHAALEGEELRLHGRVLDLTGSRMLEDRVAVKPGRAEEAGTELGEKLLGLGARSLLPAGKSRGFSA